MNRRTFLLGVAGASACQFDSRPRLNVFNWSAYIAAETVPNFEQEFGVRVRYSTYESNEEMLARVMSGNSGWDIVFPTQYLIEPMREQSLLSAIDHKLLPNLKHLEARYQSPEWDPQLANSVPYLWNGTGILYNSKTPVNGWADLWTQRMSRKITMLDDPVDYYAACFKHIGLSANSAGQDAFGRAQAAAKQQKPLLRAFINAEVRDQVVSGDVMAAQLWSTTAQQAIDAAPHLAYCYPQEGFVMNCDSAVILRESSRTELAHRFIDYLHRPAVNAKIVAEARTGTTNAAARTLLPPEILKLPALFPSDEIWARAEWVRSSTPAVQRLRDRLWTELKSSS